LYSPLVKRDTFLKQESNGFLEKVFKGDMKELLATFVNNRQISASELEYLRGLLDDQDNSDGDKT
jgi:Predicted transcriptional regulator